MEIVEGFKDGSKEVLVKESTKWGKSQVEAADRQVFVAVMKCKMNCGCGWIEWQQEGQDCEERRGR